MSQGMQVVYKSWKKWEKELSLRATAILSTIWTQQSPFRVSDFQKRKLINSCCLKPTKFAIIYHRSTRKRMMCLVIKWPVSYERFLILDVSCSYLVNKCSYLANKKNCPGVWSSKGGTQHNQERLQKILQKASFPRKPHNHLTISKASKVIFVLLTPCTVPESQGLDLCWIFSVSCSDPFSTLPHCALSSERLTFMEHISGLPCSPTSRWLQPIGGTIRRLEGGRRRSLGSSFTQLPSELLQTAASLYWRPPLLSRGTFPTAPFPRIQ